MLTMLLYIQKGPMQTNLFYVFRFVGDNVHSVYMALQDIYLPSLSLSSLLLSSPRAVACIQPSCTLKRMCRLEIIISPLFSFTMWHEAKRLSKSKSNSNSYRALCPNPMSKKFKRFQRIRLFVYFLQIVLQHRT